MVPQVGAVEFFLLSLSVWLDSWFPDWERLLDIHVGTPKAGRIHSCSAK